MTVLEYLKLRIGDIQIQAHAASGRRKVFRVVRSFDGVRHTITLTGNFAGSESIRLVLDHLDGICSGPSNWLVLDVVGVERASSSFVALLVLIRRRTRASRLKLTIRASEEVRLWLRHCRLELVLRECLVGCDPLPATEERTRVDGREQNGSRTGN